MVLKPAGYSKHDGQRVRSFTFLGLSAYLSIFPPSGDLHDLLLSTVVPHLTFSTPYSYSILAFTLISFIFLLIILPFIPLRPLFLVVGLTPFFITHPLVRVLFPPLLVPYRKRLQMRITRLVDDDRLEDHHLKGELSEVELWENERYGPVSGGGFGFSKTQLKKGERKGWTRGRDGWSLLDEEGNGDVRSMSFTSPFKIPNTDKPLRRFSSRFSRFLRCLPPFRSRYSSNLTFDLESGWAFVETEDWRKDLEASWAGDVESDEDGWVYTNGIWMEPRSAPLDEWLSSSAGATRRRR